MKFARSPTRIAKRDLDKNTLQQNLNIEMHYLFFKTNLVFTKKLCFTPNIIYKV